MGIATDNFALTAAADAPFCWQGWRTRVPREWDLVRLEGGHDAGSAVFTQDHAPRFVLRWMTAPPRRAASWVEAARRKAGGDAGAVWAAYSAISGRGNVAALAAGGGEAVMPFIADTAPEAAAEWAVFGLRCTVPAGFTLVRHALNAGDLSLHFAATRPARWLCVREIGPARVALRRLRLDQWLDRQEVPVRARYRASGEPGELTLATGVAGLSRRMSRRRRLFFARRLPREVVTYALHDGLRDRIVIVQGSGEELVGGVASGVGRLAEAGVGRAV